jgi:hypothetical protein
VGFQEPLFHGLIALADFTQHPANRLVDQIVFVSEQQLGNRERVVVLALLDVVQRREDRDAPLPYGTRLREFVQQRAISLIQMRADNRIGRCVDEIPVVDVLRVSEVQLVDGVPRRLSTPFVLPHENQQGEQPFFVPSRLQERAEVLQ